MIESENPAVDNMKRPGHAEADTREPGLTDGKGRL